MKHLIYLLVILSLFVSCHDEARQKDNEIQKEKKVSPEQTATNDWMQMKLMGKARSISENSYEATEESGEVQKRIRINSDSMIDVFNNKGNEIEKDIYSSDGSLGYKYLYQYDDRGNRTDET